MGKGLGPVPNDMTDFEDSAMEVRTFPGEQIGVGIGGFPELHLTSGCESLHLFPSIAGRSLSDDNWISLNVCLSC
ncbi:hypothetical protein H671_1g0333 [Cricetulus griseus]|nr:hypothetical protein H671_1g0333 [Cricetulus griseus]